jgi:N-methylhydantoinase B
VDPVTLSVMSAALSGIAEEMGTVLIRSATSSNIKERRDCSAALFDATGRMVAQAEHIPVHLGAMPESVAAVIDLAPEPDAVYVLNDPFAGGSHLPDITLVSPLVLDDAIAGYACTRAHHADVGGMVPGSMPAGSTSIWQEGLIVPPVRLDEDILRVILANVRTPDHRRADQAAQTAANRLGGERLAQLAARHGRETVRSAFDEIIAYTERRAREAIRGLPNGRFEADGEVEGDGVVDDDLPIRVAVTIADDSIELDFEGTETSTHRSRSPAQPASLR